MWLERPAEHDPANPEPGVRRAEITLHQLRIFWAIAHSETLTRAAKQLGMAQPSMSQQLSRLETVVGTRLFDRRASQMVLTEAGGYLLPRAEHVLRSIDDLEEGLAHFREGRRITVRLAGITSMLRMLLPGAVERAQERHPEIDFDIHDGAPADILELLYSRRVRLGLLAANSVAPAGVGFLAVPLLEDFYVLAVPDSLALDGITDPAGQLAPGAFGTLNRAVQFTFGTRHTQRVEAWYERMLPDHRVVAHCRSFEMALGLVAAGAGVCLAPALATLVDGGALRGVRLYRIDEPARRLVALIASQYRHQAPYAALIEALQQTAAAVRLPDICPTPPFLESASDTDAAAAGTGP